MEKQQQSWINKNVPIFGGNFPCFANAFACFFASLISMFGKVESLNASLVVCSPPVWLMPQSIYVWIVSFDECEFVLIWCVPKFWGEDALSEREKSFAWKIFNRLRFCGSKIVGRGLKVSPNFKHQQRSTLKWTAAIRITPLSFTLN